MSFFLSKDEELILWKLQEFRPQGIHENMLKSVTAEALINRKFAIKSDAGYLYTTVNGLKYLQDQGRFHIENKVIIPTRHGNISQKILKLFLKISRIWKT